MGILLDNKDTLLQFQKLQERRSTTKFVSPAPRMYTYVLYRVYL